MSAISGYNRLLCESETRRERERKGRMNFVDRIRELIYKYAWPKNPFSCRLKFAFIY